MLSADGGALEQMAKPIQYGFGAPLGSGEQYQSWIHINDVVRIFLFALEQNLDGVYNAVGDHPVTNGQLTKAIANTLNRPLWLAAIPAFILKMALGEMAGIVLESQYVLNDKIKAAGFQFEFVTVENALKDVFSN